MVSLAHERDLAKADGGDGAGGGAAAAHKVGTRTVDAAAGVARHCGAHFAADDLAACGEHGEPPPDLGCGGCAGGACAEEEEGEIGSRFVCLSRK